MADNKPGWLWRQRQLVKKHAFPVPGWMNNLSERLTRERFDELNKLMEDERDAAN